MNKFIRYILFLVCAGGLIVTGCIEDPEMSTDIRNASVPDVILLTGTGDEYEIQKTATTITIQAEVLSANGAPVEKYGICWGLNSNPTVESGDTVIAGKGIGEFSATAVQLNSSQEYYIRPYATNKKGTSYGDELLVSTADGLGVVRTLVPTERDIKATAITCGGKIIDAGEGEIEERGILLTTQKEDEQAQEYPFTMETDSFYQEITGLKPLTTYYIRAYVKNSFGRFVGEWQTVTTTDGKPVFASFKLLSKDYSSADFVAVLKSQGDADVTASGFCYSESNEIPTVEDEKVACVLQNDSLISGKLQGLKQQTRYYVRAYAENSFGISYSSGDPIVLIVKSQAPTVTTSEIEADDLSVGSVSVSGVIQDKGESDIVDAGFCWSSTKSEPTILDSKIQTFKGDSLITGVITGLKGGTKYYIRAYATNSVVTSYGETRELTTPNIITSLTAYPGKNVTEAAVCVSNGIGYVMGGDLGGTRSTEMYAYDAQTGAWQSKAPAKVGVKGASFFPLNSFSILCLGGKDDRDAVSNAFYYYSVQRNEWNDLGGNDAHIYLYDASGISIDNDAYYFGGSANDTINSRILKFSGWTESWSEVGTFPEKQLGSVVEEIGETVYVGLGMTGTGLSGVSYSKRLWASASSDMLSWTEKTPCPTEAQGLVCGTKAGNKLYVLDTNLNMWVYNPADDSWAKKNTAFASKLSADNLNSLFMYSVDSYIYIGMTTGSKTFIKYDPQWDN